MFLQWRHVEDRIPPPDSWTVFESKELRSKVHTLPLKIQKGLAELKRKAQKGDSLRPHLSRNIIKATSNDPMMMDWQITHFHLGTELDSRGLVKGTDDIVAAWFDSDKRRLYLIDVHPHRGFFSRQAFFRLS